MPAAADTTSPISQILLSVTSHISPSLMVERAANTKRQIAELLQENMHLLSERDCAQLQMSEERLLDAQQHLPSTKLGNVGKHPVKVFTATRKYHNRVQEYYLQVQRLTFTAQMRNLFGRDNGNAGHAGPDQQFGEDEEGDDEGGEDPETPPLDILSLKFENVEVEEAGTGTSVELHYGDDRSITLSLKIIASEEGNDRNQYLVSGTAELVPEAAGALDEDAHKYRVQSVTDVAVIRVADSGLESDNLAVPVDATTVVPGHGGQGTSVLLNVDGVTISISVDNEHGDNTVQV